MCIKPSRNDLHVGICNNFQPFRDGSKDFTRLEIQQSATEGCAYCSVISQAIGKLVPDSQDDTRVKLMINPPDYSDAEVINDFGTLSLEPQNAVGTGVDPAPVQITVQFEDKSLVQSVDSISGMRSVRMSIYNPSDLEHPDTPALGTMRRYSSRSDSPETFEFLQSMLQKCLTAHTSCVQPSSFAPPKRQLNISGERINLTEPNPDDPSAKKYAALSHCWGPTVPIKTLHETIEQFKRGIKWQDLSETFKDGIAVARRLGIDWIWIDSLCIVQNDTSDWEVEASKMSDYYQNAHVTISATSSPNGSVPFLQARDSMWTPARFQSMKLDGKPLTVEARLIPDKSYSHTITGWGPLTTRAWTFQEHVLSTRSIQYTPAEVIWDCIEERNSETGILYINLHESLPSKLKTPGIYGMWYDMVQRYSQRQITFESDRLPAIGGVARVIAQGSKSTYVSRLWKEDFLKGLCWRVIFDTSNRVVVSDENKVPSWSWASLSAPIAFLDEEVISFFPTVVDMSCEIVGLNPFGTVSGGTATLKGQLAEISICCTEPSDWENRYHMRQPTTPKGGKKGAKGFPITPDGALQEYEFRAPGDKVQKTLRRAREKQENRSFEAQAYAIAIAQCERNNMVCGLILGPSESSPNAFTRLGTFFATRKKLWWLKGSSVANVSIL